MQHTPSCGQPEGELLRRSKRSHPGVSPREKVFLSMYLFQQTEERLMGVSPLSMSKTCNSVTPIFLPPGGRWPPKGGERGMRAKIKRIAPCKDLLKCLCLGDFHQEDWTYPKLLRYHPHSSSVKESVPKSRFLPAKNCGVIAPGNHWIRESLRGAPPRWKR